MIETIDITNPTNRAEVVDVLGLAFKDHPMLRSDASGKRSLRMIRGLLNTFERAPDAQTFGIRHDGRVVAAAFVHADGYEPGKWAMAKMLCGMARVVGLRQLPAALRAMGYERPGNERRLELLLLGTLAEHQQRGHGRALMHHVLDIAREKNFDAVVLEVAKDTPAEAFYRREGFTSIHEIDLFGMKLCYMHRRV